MTKGTAMSGPVYYESIDAARLAAARALSPDSSTEATASTLGSRDVLANADDFASARQALMDMVSIKPI